MENNTLVENDPATGRIPYPSGLSLKILNFLDDVSYEVMRTEDQLEDIFRLRHDTYKHAGYIHGNPDGRLRDELDLSPNVFNVAIRLSGVLVGCIRLHKMTSEFRDSCAIEVFPDEINPKLDAGAIIIDASRNCCDPSFASRSYGLPLAVLRASVMLSVHSNADWMLATCKQSHSSFFRRLMGGQHWHDEGKLYMGLDRETVIDLLATSSDFMKHSIMTKQQYFLSTPEERASLFDVAVGPVSATAKKILTGEVVDPYWL